ncbi:thiolase domain-containing protein [Candidatus Amarolinea aalborgensis]|uniref:thiolase domain-containing protein n=1 Tax=Candidatus Amarolinea aalborgensis TaxID=2249329 RepID=UPI003BF9B043
MRSVSIIGIGQTPVGEIWDRSLRHLGHDALIAALSDAGVESVDALYVGNMLSGELAGQEHLGALMADFVGWRGVEALKIEAACASGAAALRVGYLAVASGAHDVVAVLGVEKMTDTAGEETTTGLALAADQEYEAAEGVSFVGLNAMLMQRYMHQYGVKHEAFANFTVNAHRNALNNPNAMFHLPLTVKDYVKSSMIAAPVNLLDSSPICDGAAAVILCASDRAREFGLNRPPVRILASAVATDTLAVHDRRDPLMLEAGFLSAQRAYAQAGMTPRDINLFEAHDAFTIMSALSLEAAGFADPGHGVRLAEEGEIAIGGRVPISTMGGLKARGHPVGATGVYQIVELVQQLQGQAGANQVPHARIGMAQNIGGSGATIITHILANEP